IQIDTTNILFIIGGAFDGMDEIIKRRIGEKVIGFGGASSEKFDDKDAIMSRVRPDDLQSYSLIPEFIGRVPIISNLEELDVRSEEHTSELQSRFDLVCRLLLEKKNVTSTTQ